MLLLPTLKVLMQRMYFYVPELFYFSNFRGLLIQVESFLIDATICVSLSPLGPALERSYTYVQKVPTENKTRFK